MADEWLKSLGGQIKAARETRGWNQERLAGEIGVARQTLSAYERGKMPPGFDKVAKIAAALSAEFEVEGCRITAADLPPRIIQASEQLCLEWDTDYTVSATVVIRPVQGAIHIGGLAKLPKRA